MSKKKEIEKVVFSKVFTDTVEENINNFKKNSNKLPIDLKDVLSGKVKNFQTKDSSLERMLAFGLACELKESYENLKDNNFEKQVEMINNLLYFITNCMKPINGFLCLKTVLSYYKLSCAPLKGEAWDNFVEKVDFMYDD